MSMKTLKLVIGFLALLLATERTALAQWHAWNSATDVPEAPVHCGAAQLNGRSYMICGWAGYASATNREFDPVTATWAIRAGATFGVDGPACAASGGEVIVAGGANQLFSTNMEAYNPLSDTWRSLGTSWNVSRANAAFLAVDDRIHLLGGYTWDQRHQDNLVYWPASGNWEARPSMPNCRGKIAAALNGRLIRVAGGDYYDPFIHDYVPVNSHELFFVDANVWVPQQELPVGGPMSCTGAMIGQGFVICYGNLHLRYGLSAGGWESLPTHPHQVTDARMQEINGVAVVFAGFVGFSRLATSYEFYESAFFVDSQAAPGGDGSPGNPFEDFATAIASSPAEPIGATTIWARPGNYPGTPLLFDRPSLIRRWGGGGQVTIGQ